MTGLRCGCGAAIDCTYPKCKEGVEMSQSITQMLRDYARDHTTTTYHDALIRKAATEIEFHEERWDQLRQQLDALRDHQVAYETETEQQLAAKQAEVDALMLEYCPSEIRVDELKVTMTVEQTPRHLFKDLANKPETRWVPCKESGIQKMQHNVDGMWKDIPPFWID